MKQLIGTGLTGLVGSRLVELLGSKYEIFNLDLETGLDITKSKEVEQKISTLSSKVLVHLAAFTDVDKAWEERDDKNGMCYKVNVLGTRNIAQACAKYNKYLIHISTDFVFDGTKNTAYNESDKPNPIEWYGKTKLWAEEEVIKTNSSYVILRISFPFKARSATIDLEPRQKLDLVRKIIDKLKYAEEISMFSDALITPTFIDDIVKAINYCVLNQPKGTYHCSGSTPLSPYDLAIRVADIFGFDKKLIKQGSIKSSGNTSPRPRQQFLAISNEKIKKYFGLNILGIGEALAKIKEDITRTF